MSNSLRSILLLASLASLAGAARAQDAPWALNAGAIGALDALKKVTGAGTGLALGLSRELRVQETAIPLRVSLNLHVLHGKAGEGELKTSLQSLQVAGDVLLETPLRGVRWVTGFSLNRYRVSNSGVPQQDPSGSFRTYWAATPDTGVKAGLRFGLHFRTSRRWSAELLYQVTELGRTPAEVASKLMPSAVKGPTNPAWLQVGMGLHF